MTPVPNGSNSPGKTRAAVAASTLVLFALSIPLLFAFVLGVFVQPTASALPGAQPSPTSTIQTVLTVVPETGDEPTPTVKSGSGGGGGGGGSNHPNPTATPQAVPTTPPAPTATPLPTVSTGNG